MNPDYKYKQILWLVGPNHSGGLDSLLKRELKQAGLGDANIIIKCLTQGCLVKTTKTKFTWRQERYPKFEQDVARFKPDFIVCSDKAALGFLTQKYISLALTRGSIYKWKGINVMVFDEIKKNKYVKTGQWVYRQDLASLRRWITGTQRHQPKFKYKVCETLKDLQELKDFALQSKAIATDIETSGSGKNIKITCTGYTCWHLSGKVMTYVIPFVDTSKPDCCYWKTPELEKAANEVMRRVHDCQATKILQNGSYDSTHVLTYHAPYRNYTLDVLHMFHALWPEAPKRLDFISSLCLDFYRFWKDEGKEDAKDDDQKTMVPQTYEGMQDYWRYNALDCYFTMMNAVYLLQLYSVPKLKWAKHNYKTEFRLQIGPAFAASMRGCKINTDIQAKFNMDLIQESDAANVELLKMVDDPEFNPNSPKQVAELVYDILHAHPLPRKKRATGENELKLIATQHPLYKRLFKQIWATKKPANNASKYGQMPLLNDRFMYKLSVASTVTWRFSSKTSDFWYGKNIQNVPEPMRVMFEPDDGYVLFDFDYSQSDAYFTAFESEDRKYMATMVDDRDVHCVHAEFFFKKSYEELINAKNKHEEWCTHKVTGVRSVTKRVVYGANYLMGAFTLFLTMGQDAVIGAAKHLGYDDADSWNDKQLVLLCQKFLEAYFEMYPILPTWLEEEIDKAVMNNNLVSCYGGMTRLFFADLKKDKAAQRELASFFGQGGTAGNINAFIDDFFYDKNSICHDSDDIMFLFQVHDSVVGQVRIEKLHLLQELKKKMERECTIHGRTFVVPVEGQVGFGWGKRMVDWHPAIKIQELEKHESDWWAKQ